MTSAAPRVSGRTYTVAPNDQQIVSLKFQFAPDHSILTIRDHRGEHALRCGHGAWIESQSTFDSPAPRPLAATSAWTSDDTWVAKLCLYQTPFCPTLTCRFTDDQVTFDHHANVSFGPLDRPQLTGQYSDVHLSV